MRNEAKALSDLHQASYALPEGAGDTVRKHLVSYAQQVRDVEWEAMAKGQASSRAANELHNLGEAILQESLISRMSPFITTSSTCSRS